jgi:DNA adenine methylase Dam
MEFKKEELIKSPLNYTGGKFKLLPQILLYIPNDINTFVDLFSGGCNIGVNIKANNIVCNDIESHVISLMQYLKENDEEYIFKKILEIIKEYNLSDLTNKDGYLKLREVYNKSDVDDFNRSIMFYALCCCSFSNQIRFNSKGGFNMPYGKRDFNKNMRNNLSKYINKINNINIDFINKDFKELSLDNLNNQDLIYCDPPYLITLASYNEKDGWNETHERELLQLLDNANDKGIRFALSNVLENKGKSNDILKEWCKKYNTYHLNNTYSNCNYHAKDKSKNTTDEVLITNYII